MVNKIGIHSRIFFQAFRTAIIFVIGFIIYEFIVKYEKKQNKVNPSNSMFNLHKLNYIKFLLIFCIDLCLLYILHLVFRVDM